MHQKIGVFDSGFGGLEVLSSMTRALPAYSYVYLADTARAPYGDRSAEEISRFTTQALEFLRDQDCGLLVVACNSASCQILNNYSRAMHEYQTTHIPILGVPYPCAHKATTLTKNKKIGVLATRATVRSRTYTNHCNYLDPQSVVTEQACPGLVELIESGHHTSQEFVSLLQHYLAPLLAAQVDTIILGCTHYGLVSNTIQSIVGETVNLVTAGEAVTENLVSFLQSHSTVAAHLSTTPEQMFYSTRPSRAFDERASGFYGHPIHAHRTIIDTPTNSTERKSSLAN